MLEHIEPGDAVQTLDIQLANAPLNGTSVATGATPTRSGPLATSVAGGLGFYEGDPIDITANTVTHDAGDASPRKDIVYIDTLGTPQILKGTPAEALGPDATTYAEAPFRFWSPSPPPMSQIPGIPIAEVAIDQAATDYDATTQFRDIRPTPEAVFNTLEAYTDLQIPTYDSLSEVTGEQSSLIQITGAGTDERGLWHHFGGTIGWERIGEQATLADVVINSDKDWGGFDIRNVGGLEAQSLSVRDGNGDINRLPTIRYGENQQEEIARITLDPDQVLEIGYLEVKMKGGGTNPNFTIDYYDETNASVIVSTSDRFRAVGGSNAYSTPGASVIMRFTNNTGGVAHVSINEITRIVDVDEV